MKQILDQIASSSSDLFQCLTKEHDALSLNQLDKLVPLSEQKQQLVNTLDQLDQQRQASCGQQSFTHYLNTLDPKLTSHWQSIEKLVKKCQQQNEVNGRLLNRHNSLTREALEILTGKKLNSDHTYGPDGLQTGNSSIVTNIEA